MKKRVICLILGCVMMALQVMPVSAATEQQLRQEKDEAEARLSDTNDAIEALSQKQMAVQSEINAMDADMVDLMIQIDATKEDIKNTEDSITATQSDITVKENDIAGKEEDIEAKKAEIKQTEADLEKAEADQQRQYEDMKKRIQYIYENGGDAAWLNMIFGAGSISAMLNRAEYAQSMHEYDRESLDKYIEVVKQVRELKDTLETQESELESQKAELESQKAELEAQKADLEAQKESLESQRGDLESQQADLQSRIDEMEATNSDYASQLATARQQASEISSLIARQEAEIARMEEERRAEEQRRAEEERRREQEAAEAARRAEEAARQSENQTSPSSPSNPSTPSQPSEPAPQPSSGSVSGSAIVAYADQFVGNPYVWGGNSLTNGIDCSHFVWQVLKNCGVYSGGYTTSSGWRSKGRAVGSLAEAQAGDVICYSGHVAIYDGYGGIVEAKGSKWGITHDRSVTCKTILAIRRFV